MFDHFILVSTHPGLTEKQEKTKRIEMDLFWARLISSSSWENFLQQWNDQPIFDKVKTEPLRQECNFDKEKLASSMNLWSLGQQEDMRKLIQENQHSIFIEILMGTKCNIIFS